MNNKENYIDCGDAINGHFFLRNQGGKIMMIGVVLNEDIKLSSDGEIWQCALVVGDIKKFHPPERFKHKRADQILTTCVDLKELIPIEK